MKKVWLFFTFVLIGCLLYWCFPRWEGAQISQNCQGQDSCLNLETENEQISSHNTEVPSFEALDEVVQVCHIEEMWGYSEKITQHSFLLPYHEGYLGFKLGGQDGRQLALTYRKKTDPCTLISISDTIFWWNPFYKPGETTFRGASYPDNKIFYDQGLRNGIPTQKIAKKLNCEAGKGGVGSGNLDCKKAALNYFYKLFLWREQDDYFDQWMRKFKEDIIQEKYTSWDFWLARYDVCFVKVKEEIWEIQANDSDELRWKYTQLLSEKLHACAKEYLTE